MGKTEPDALSTLVLPVLEPVMEEGPGREGSRSPRCRATKSKRILFQEASSFDSAGYQDFRLASFLFFIYIHLKRTQFTIIDRKPASLTQAEI